MVGLAEATLLAVGVLSGAINVLAGGGGLLALPALVLAAGLGAEEANGTFRVAVLAQSLVAIAALRRRGATDLGAAMRLAPPVLIGAALGAWQATTYDETATRRLLLGACLLATAVWLADDALRRRPAGAQEATAPRGEGTRSGGRRLGLLLALAVVGWYGGLIQAGVGFLLLLVLQRSGGMALPVANVRKVELVLLFTPVAMVAFGHAGRIAWGPGLVLAAGMAIGAQLGVGLALGPRAVARIRWTTAAMVVASLVSLAVEADAQPARPHAPLGPVVRVFATLPAGAEPIDGAAASEVQRQVKACAGGRDVDLWLTVEAERGRGRRRGALRATTRLLVDGADLGERELRGGALPSLLKAVALLSCVALQRLPPAPPRRGSDGAPSAYRPASRRDAAAAPSTAPLVALPAQATVSVAGPAPAPLAQPSTPTAAWGVEVALGAEVLAAPRLGIHVAMGALRRGPRLDFAVGLRLAAARAGAVADGGAIAGERGGVALALGRCFAIACLRVEAEAGALRLREGAQAALAPWLTIGGQVRVRSAALAGGRLALLLSVAVPWRRVEVRSDGALRWRSPPLLGHLALGWTYGAR